ncbi:PREDICTED: anthrax toxin receptor-like isoform X2 [Chinchilla lanigera]|uniref:anthrax toxin receptor-like isoform X2 n=1 Tax=Chinchilla lanigera TaxID=34839 RepID=UPI00038E9995|nr:PREDICTED: anthrax toxin receptor-like isoform X2 [Chinchilla lanigera]
MQECCPRVPDSSLFLLLLLLLLAPLFRSLSVFYPKISWRHFHPSSLNSANNSQYSHHREGRQIWNEEDEDVLQYCDGAFDVYYVFDGSKAMSDWKELCISWGDLVEKYVNPKLRMSFIVFSTRSSVKMPLTGDRITITYQLGQLPYSTASGETYLHEGLKQANAQITRANSGGTKVSSMIITLLSGPMAPDVFNEVTAEVDKARRMGAYIYSIGVDRANPFQVASFADSPEHVFRIRGPLSELRDKVDYIATRACLELRAVKPSPLCTGAKQVVLKGYGFHNAQRLDQIICRFKLGVKNVIDERPISMNMTTIICPQPQQLKHGQNISVEVSLNNGRDFLSRRISVKTTTNCIQPTPQPPTRTTTPSTTTTTTVKTATTTTTTKTTPTRPRPTSSARPLLTASAPVTPRPPAITALQTTPTLRSELPETKPSQALLLLTGVLGLLLIPMVLWWIWWLCCRTKRRAKKPARRLRRPAPPPPTSPPPPHSSPPPPPVPPPAPTPPPVTVYPTIIVCCCAYCGVCVKTGPEGTFVLCNFSHPSCHQVPLMRSPSCDQGSCTNFDLPKMLCAQAPWHPKIGLQPSLDSLPLACCSRCHHPAACSARSPSRMLHLFHRPAQTACRSTLSLPPP